VAVALMASACAGHAEPVGSPGPASRTATTGATTAREVFPLTLRSGGRAVVLEHRPSRVVSLSPTATEMLFAVGAGDQVVAVDEDSNYPPGAPTTSLSGLQPNVEAIVTFQPDLVVISGDVGNLVKSLRAVGVPVLIEPAANTLADTYAQIDQLGMATGHAAEAVRVVSRMRSDIAALVASAPTFPAPLTYYHELDQTFYTVTSKTFIGQIYSLVGLRNIADRAQGATSGYPQLSAEYIVNSDPDLIFLADTKCCGQSATTVARRPGWNQIAAVRTGHVVLLDDDVASRWGPRVVDFLRTVVHAMSQLKR